MTPRMEINVLVDEDFAEHLSPNWLKKIAGKTLSCEKAEPGVEMSLLVTGQERVQELNRVYRGLDEPTDVLAFGMLPDPAMAKEAGFTAAPDGVMHLGEVIISYPQALKQAEVHGHPVKTELAILTIHGVLHLLGHDHAEAEPERQMKKREAEILSRIEELLE